MTGASAADKALLCTASLARLTLDPAVRWGNEIQVGARRHEHETQFSRERLEREADLLQWSRRASLSASDDPP